MKYDSILYVIYSGKNNLNLQINWEIININAEQHI